MEKTPVEYPVEINHHWHTKHPLRILEDTSKLDVICLSCGKLIKEEMKKKKDEEKKKDKDTKFYSCSTCGDFNVHLDCARNPKPPPLVVDRPKTHEHSLMLIPREVSFTCNACGTKGNVSPYVCISCSFMIHTKCSNLPRVIRINRHSHRLTHTFSLGSEKMVDCGVCRKGIDCRYGAYSSSQPYSDIAFHTGCATREDVWDGIDLEGVPEDEIVLDPFEVTSGSNTIKHFSHEEHDLRLTNTKGEHVSDKRCSACNLHVFCNPFYKCVECDDIILHEKCAKLGRKIRIPLHQHALTLSYGNIFNCAACDHTSNGFRYSCADCSTDFDTQCVSISDPFDYGGGHAHPLYLLTSEDNINCSACDQDTSHQMMLGCVQCTFGLCFACATLPETVPYEDDPHTFSLNHGEKPREDMLEEISQLRYWCDSCEKQVNPLQNFYECPSCGTIIHTKCALGGSFRNIRIGVSFDSDGYKCTLVPNDQANRPSCSQCGIRHGLLLVKGRSGDNNIVARNCSTCYLSRKER